MKAKKGDVVRSGGHGYEAVLADVVRLIEAARGAAARSVNAVMTATYWTIGRSIVEEEQRGATRAGYGEKLIVNLSRDLQARFGRGFGRANLFQMKAFFLAYRDMVQTGSGLSGSDAPAKIVQTASGQSPAAAGLASVAARFPLPWSHYVRLLSVRNVNARRFYEEEALRVHGKALDGELLDDARRPLAKLDAALGVDLVTDGGGTRGGAPMSTRGRGKGPRGPTKGRSPEPEPEPVSAADDAFRDVAELVAAAQQAGGQRSKSAGRPSGARSSRRAAEDIPELATVVGEATTDDAQLKALSASLHGLLQLPADGFVVGEPVEVVAIDYDGNPRRGLTATCRRREELHTVSLADVSFSPGQSASVVALYRQWLGLQAAGEPPHSTASSSRRHKVNQSELELGQPVELVVLACKSNALRCRLPGTERELTLRTAVRDEVPGEIITVVPAKSWTHARHPYLSGVVEASRLDVQALGLVPLDLRAEGDWDPDHEYWGEEREPIAEWARPIIARGRRPAFEMEQVIPGADPEDIDSDPILEASDLHAAEYYTEARELLMRLLAADLRCLDAHSHLGNWEFDHWPAQALRHYAAGVGIGALSLGTAFDGVLPWGRLDNRPFLRCLHGLGISFWKLGHTREAAGVFRRMLWLNPSDNQGARFNLAAVADGLTWEEIEGGDA